MCVCGGFRATLERPSEILPQSVREERSDATTGNACRRTSSATRWCLVGTEATSQEGRAAGRSAAIGAESRRNTARLGATTADVDRTRSSAAAATAAATAPTRSAVPFAVSSNFYYNFYADNAPR